jgi:hypothetical protein
MRSGCWSRPHRRAARLGEVLGICRSVAGCPAVLAEGGSGYQQKKDSEKDAEKDSEPRIHVLWKKNATIIFYLIKRNTNH